MSILHDSEMSHDNGRSKAFLLGLYIGLSLLLLFSYLDVDHISKLHVATNIYAVQALAGAVLCFWRIRKRARNPEKIPALASVFICFGLAVWVIGQILWTWAAWPPTESPVPYPGWSDIFYILADASWVAALLMIFKSLGRRGIIESSPFLAIVTTSLGLLVAGVVGIHSQLVTDGLSSSNLPKLVCDLIYVLVNFLSMILAIALVIGENKEIPFPVHQCIRYLCAATAINAVAILAFIVTTKDKLINSTLGYFNGNWVDWLFLTAMYCWGVSALRCPIRQEELEYTFGSKRTLREEDIYQSAEIAKRCWEAAHATEERIAYSDHIRWILDNIPGCWRVIKLGELVVGSTFLFPLPRLLAKNFVEGKVTEFEMFEESKKDPDKWECLYLADASILPKHRRRRLASNCFERTIDNIAKEHCKPQIEVYCWPRTLERRKLTEQLQRDFKERGISVISKD
jgi:hypothetical protein